MPQIDEIRRGPAFDVVPDELLRELKASISDIVPPAPVEPEATVVAQAPAPVHPFDVWARQARQPHQQHPPVRTARMRYSFLSLLPWFLGAGVVVAGLLYVSQYGLKVKGRVVQQGNAAISSLMSAKADLEQMDIGAAQNDFAAAARQFDDAAKSLNILGPTFTSVLSKVPGLGALKTSNDIISAGQKFSDAGRAISEALSVLSASGGVLDTNATDRLSLAKVFLPLQDALTRADRDIQSASALIAGINESAIPEQYRGQYQELTGKLPDIRAMVDRASATVAFMSRFTGTDRPRRYLLLFQNSSELRPTGGFPGSYGLITFENGRVTDVRADDIYNPDGQITDLVVPPLQLQGITPSWGMRDAAWWIDFPTSARKVAEYYTRGGGAAVDGVIAFKPEVIADILRITGPVSLPGYDLVLDADNFLATVQLEVESKKTPEPKKIIMDLAPIIMERMANAPASQWARLLQLFKGHLDSRDMLMHFDDAGLEKYASDEKWNGSVVVTPGDYLMVDISNVKGAKGDAVTDTSLKLEGRVDGGTMTHLLTLTREHNGGDSQYAFYNKTNYSYVRVLVPKGSVLRGISGNDHPGNKPLMKYAGDAERDSDLQALEATYQYDAVRDATTYEESGKTGFGFWMKVAPGQTQQVQLEYVVPAQYVATDYHLYMQRQPGLDIKNAEFTIQKEGGVTLENPGTAWVQWPDSWRLNDPLAHDLDVTVTLRK